MIPRTHPTSATDSRLMLEGVETPEHYLTETILTLTSHESVRKFEPTPVPDAMLDVIMSAARSAPTSSNLQAYSVIVVDDGPSRTRLAAIAGDQDYIAEAPLFVVFCADIARLRYLSARQGRTFGGDTLEMFLLSSVDATLVMQNALVAAESLGLGVTPIGGVRDFPDQMAEELGLPEGVYAVAGLCLGFERPGARRGTKPRLPAHVTVHRNRYDMSTLDDGVREYDTTMIDRGTYAGRQIAVSDAAARPVDTVRPADEVYGWAEHTAIRCSHPDDVGGSPLLGRRDLRNQLERRGFSFT